MLVLSRKKNQTIVIDDVEITVLKCSGGGVRLGVEAPQTTKILRGELVTQALETKPNQKETESHG